MGCFSFICTVCGDPINSDSFSGEDVKLSLLKNGEIIEEMQGQYDSYGRVFTDEKDPNDKSLTPVTSCQWNLDWGDVCDLMFDDNRNSGISAAHCDCINEGHVATRVSESDPDQGWGDYRHEVGKAEHYHYVKQ